MEQYRFTMRRRNWNRTKQTSLVRKVIRYRISGDVKFNITIRRKQLKLTVPVRAKDKYEPIMCPALIPPNKTSNRMLIGAEQTIKRWPILTFELSTLMWFQVRLIVVVILVCLKSIKVFLIQAADLSPSPLSICPGCSFDGCTYVRWSSQYLIMEKLLLTGQDISHYTDRFQRECRNNFGCESLLNLKVSVIQW